MAKIEDTSHHHQMLLLLFAKRRRHTITWKKWEKKAAISLFFSFVIMMLIRCRAAKSSSNQAQHMASNVTSTLPDTLVALVLLLSFIWFNEDDDDDNLSPLLRLELCHAAVSLRRSLILYKTVDECKPPSSRALMRLKTNIMKETEKGKFMCRVWGKVGSGKRWCLIFVDNLPSQVTNMCAPAQQKFFFFTIKSFAVYFFVFFLVSCNIVARAVRISDQCSCNCIHINAEKSCRNYKI